MASEDNTAAKPSVTARELHESVGGRLNLKLLSGREGLDNSITSDRIQKLGLALTGYVDYLHKGRVQFLGGTEINYLRMLDADRRKASVAKAFSREVCCIVVTRKLRAPADLLRNAKRNKVPVFQTDALSSTAIEEVSSFLKTKLAPSSTIHGVLMESFWIRCAVAGCFGDRKERVRTGLDTARAPTS